MKEVIGVEQNKPGSKQKVLSLQTSACQKLFSKSLAEAASNWHWGSAPIMHPQCIIQRAKLHLGSKRCLWTPCRSAVVPPTGPADPACKAPVETRAGQSNQFSTAWCILPFSAPTSHVCFWKPRSTFTVSCSLPGKNNLQSFAWVREVQFSQ